MFEAFLVVAAVHIGVDRRVVALMAIAIWAPFLALGGVAFHLIRNRTRLDNRAAIFCQSVARESRAGEPLRNALRTAAAASGAASLGEALESGAAIDEVVPMLRIEFPEIGVELATIVRSVASSGSPASGLFDELGDLALAQLEMREEILVATAPARASAFVLVGLPMAYLAVQLGAGRLEDLTAHPLQQGLASIGVLLVLMGIGVSFWLVRRIS